MTTPLRRILHLDLDAFYCSVEEQHNPHLRGKPFAVGGRPEERGVVSSCSYPARARGVRSAMPMGRALRLCPELIVLPGNHRLYGQVSHAIMDVLRQITPQIEQISIDEAFLDASQVVEDPRTLALRLQTLIGDKFELPCSLGIASNKLVAKIATDAGKAGAARGQPPNAITVVPPGQEAEFLAPLPVQALWGVGPKTAARLAQHGILTIGQLASREVVELQRLFGVHGLEMARHAQGIDNSPIITSHEIKSISQETTFVRDVRDEHVLMETLQEMAHKVGLQLRKNELQASTVKLKIRWPDFTTLTRQVSFEQPVTQDEPIFAAALDLLRRVWQGQQPVRLIGVGVSGLKRPSPQLSLFDLRPAEINPPAPENPQLQAAIDQLRQRFGAQVIQTAKQIKEKPT